MKELNTTYRLCGKRAEYLHWRKKNEVIRRLRATQPVGAGRDGMCRPEPRSHVRAPQSETLIAPARLHDKDNAILFSIYYICRFLLFFRISIFYFLVDALRNSPVVLDPLRSVDRSCDRRFSILFWHALDFGRVWLEPCRYWTNYWLNNNVSIFF